MEYWDYPLLCYWGGEIKEGNGTVNYKGGDVRIVLAASKMSLKELLAKMYQDLKLDQRSVELKVKMRFPTLGGFKVMPLSNDRFLKALWAVIKHSSAASMDLYVELVPVPSPPQVSLPSKAPSLPIGSVAPQHMQAGDLPYSSSGSSTRMSINDQYSLEHLSSPASYSQVTSSFPISCNNEQRRRNNNGSACASINTNYIDETEIDREAQEADEDLNDYTFLDESDSEDDDVASSAPFLSFDRIDRIDESFVNSWRTLTNMHSFNPGDEFVVGHKYSKDMLHEAVSMYSVMKNQSYKVVKSKPELITLVCNGNPPCHWRLRARKHFCSKTFIIITYKGPHAVGCVGSNVAMDHHNLFSKFIMYHMRELVKADCSMKVRAIIEVIKQRFHYAISYKKAWLIKQQAIADVYGDWEKSFKILPRFMQAMIEANPGTVVHITNLSTASPTLQIFQRVFWAFGPSIKGFNHCRPLMTINGTDLYGKYKGTLLIAMGCDANNQLFPLAFAIVEGENDNSWPWFMSCIRKFVTQRSNLCVISGQHLEIVKVMNKFQSGWEEPYVQHRLCTRQLASNLLNRFKSQDVKNMFEWTTEQCQEKKFVRGFNKIGEINEEAHRYLDEIPRCQWSLCHDGGFRYGIKTTNLAEAFNDVMKEARFLPITALVQKSFYGVNAYFVERREWANKRLVDGHLYSERISNILEKNMSKASHHHVLDHDDDLYQITTCRGDRTPGKGGHTHTVSIRNKTCTCKKLQIFKVPCSHTLVVCRSTGLSPSQFVDPFYSSKEYNETYKPSFCPIADKAYWAPYTGPTMVPDDGLRRGRVQSKSKRVRKEKDETTRGKITCSICRQKGHNKKSCRFKGASGTRNDVDSSGIV